MIKAEQIIADSWNSYEDGTFHATVEDVIEMMEEYADQFKPKWIPVEERLPEQNKMVLVTSRIVKFGKVLSAAMIDDEGKLFGCEFNNKFHELNSVTHWMPLPTPPQP